MQQRNLLVHNNVNIAGKILSKPIFNHELYGESFYSFSVEIPRLSNVVDIIPVIISERTIDRKKLTINSYVNIDGQIRSYNNYTDQDKRKLILNIFVQNIILLDNDDNYNEVILDGYICKPPIYRTTPLGREITDILLAVNRSYNKSDYIPCIAWGRNANFIKELKVGNKIEINGRFQSREYQKQYDNGELVNKIAYEVSISTVRLPDCEEDNQD